jgi:hypothetical protein
MFRLVIPVRKMVKLEMVCWSSDDEYCGYELGIG